MHEPMSCCPDPGGYCDRCELLLGLPVLHVTGVQRGESGVPLVGVESSPAPMGCPACGVLARGHGRDGLVLDGDSWENVLARGHGRDVIELLVKQLTARWGISRAAVSERVRQGCLLTIRVLAIRV